MANNKHDNTNNSNKKESKQQQFHAHFAAHVVFDSILFELRKEQLKFIRVNYAQLKHIFITNCQHTGEKNNSNNSYKVTSF